MNNLRNNKKFRLGFFIILMLIVVVLYFRNVNTSNLTSVEGVKSELGQNVNPDTWEKKVLLGIFSLLGVGLGMEATDHDYDLQKLAETKSLSQSRVLRDKEGNVIPFDSPLASNAKYTDEYNCDDFKSQPEAQNFFDKAGGVSADTNRLDGDKNGVACQSLPKK